MDKNKIDLCVLCSIICDNIIEKIIVCRKNKNKN